MRHWFKCGGGLSPLDEHTILRIKGTADDLPQAVLWRCSQVQWGNKKPRSWRGNQKLVNRGTLHFFPLGLIVGWYLSPTVAFSIRFSQVVDDVVFVDWVPEVELEVVDVVWDELSSSSSPQPDSSKIPRKPPFISWRSTSCSSWSVISLMKEVVIVLSVLCIYRRFLPPMHTPSPESMAVVMTCINQCCEVAHKGR